MLTDWTTIASPTIVQNGNCSGCGECERSSGKMREAATIEHSMDTLSQPPYPIIPAHELLSTMLKTLARPGEAKEQFRHSLKRTPGPKAGSDTESFLDLLKTADSNRPELAHAKDSWVKVFLIKTVRSTTRYQSSSVFDKDVSRFLGSQTS